MNRRLAAIASLALLAASVVLAVAIGAQRFPRGLSVLACLVVALLAAWWALVHRGAARFAAAAVAGALLAGVVVLVALEGRVVEDVLVLAGFMLSVAAARSVFITVLGAGEREKHVQQWSATSFEVGSDGPVAAGIDGEALQLDPPLRFHTRPQALRVRIAPHHPGASPSATMPGSPWDVIRAVARIARHGSS